MTDSGDEEIWGKEGRGGEGVLALFRRGRLCRHLPTTLFQCRQQLILGFGMQAQVCLLRASCSQPMTTAVPRPTTFPTPALFSSLSASLAQTITTSTMSNEDHPKEGVSYNGVPIQRAVTPGGHIQDTSQPAFPVYHRKFANPAPLGLFGFAATTWVLSMFNVSARGIENPELIVGLAVAYGGTAQFVAGVWEFAAGNTFGEQFQAAEDGASMQTEFCLVS